jgi:penicillin amidase
MIVDLQAGNVQALGVYPGGQSGNPGSKHYDEMVDVWSKGEYYTLDFLKSVDAPLVNESHSIQFKNK